MNRSFTPRIIATKHLLNTGRLEIFEREVELRPSEVHTYPLVKHPGAVVILPLHSDGSITLVEQFRPAIGSHTLELPAGTLGAGEDPLLCAQRELSEETGLSGAEWRSLGHIVPAPGFSDERLYLFVAKGLTQGESATEDNEEIACRRLSVAELLESIDRNDITDGKTIAMMFKARALLP